jgi:hypothetical protein
MRTREVDAVGTVRASLYVWAKAHLLLASSGIENYCRKPFGGPTDPIARWQDNCANVPRGPG